MLNKMNKRQQELTELKAFIETADKETTLLLQTLNWDQKNVLETSEMVSCKYVANHRIPLASRENHEEQCYLVQVGYDKRDVLLPDPINPDSSTVVKFGKEEVMSVINAASASNPSFKRACGGPEPLSVERLQQMYTADERAAIHAAVVAAAPFCHDLTDLALPSSTSSLGGPGGPGGPEKGRAEILSELRNMKRRRAKYRVAANTTNYSHVLRDVIKTQMDMYAEAKGVFIKTEYGTKSYVSLNKPQTTIQHVLTDVAIKQEIMSPERNHYGESIRHRRRSRSREKHERTRRSDREPDSRNRRDFHHGKDYTENRRHTDKSHDRGSKDRKHHESKWERSNRYSEVKEHIPTSRDPMRRDKLDDDHRRHKQHGRYSSKSNHEYTTSKEHDKYDKNHRKNSNRESGEYEHVKTHSDRHKSSKRQRERDNRDKIHEVQDHKNDDYFDEKKNRRR